MANTLLEVSETLYVPLLGRIYATKYHPDVLKDDSTIMVKKCLPESVQNMPGQSEYSCLAIAVLSRNIDKYISHSLTDRRTA